MIAQETATPDVVPVGAESYVVSCNGCRTEFDATIASWCSCVTTEPSLMCPACGTCFCKTPLSYKRDFWRGAPRSLRNRAGAAENATSANAVASSDENAMIPGDRPVVLFVDDSPVVRRVALAAIRGLGYNVIEAKDGAEGLELARRYRPQLVLTDALMPKMDGREMCRQIKSDAELRGTRVFVMTALYTNLRYQTEAYKTFKVDGYLEKPLAAVDLCMLLEKELEQKTA
jgi:CheY-like chemotaxis protein